MKAKDSRIIGKEELIHQVAARASLPLEETGKVLGAFADVVRENVAQGHTVRLMGFGTWTLRKVAARRLRSIRSGEPITLPEHRIVGFSAGAVLKEAASPSRA